MKKVIIPMCALVAMSFTTIPEADVSKEVNSEVSVKETIKVELKEYFKKTRETLEDHIEGLSDKQLSFKPSPNVWSFRTHH